MELIKRQRIKFTLSITLLAALFLFTTYGALLGLSAITPRAEIRGALSHALENPGTYNETAPPSLKCLFVRCEQSPTIYGDADRYGSKKSDIANAAWQKQNGRFHVDDNYFACAAKETTGGILVAVIDGTEQRKTFIDNVIKIVIIYCVSVALAGVLSFLISARILLPVSDAFSKQRDLVANASHELKTPLTVISTNFSVIKSEPKSTVEDNAKWIESIDAQVERMQELIQNMLELSKLETVEPKMVPLDFSVIVEGACLTFEPICFEKNIELVTSIENGITLNGDKSSLERLCAILIDNASKYAGENGKIGVKLTTDQKKARLSVMNTGESITKEEAAHVFDRFYRTDGARKNEDKNSFGLGLSIASATVKSHGGTISCHGIDGKGTVFTVALPLQKKQKRKTKQQ